MAGLVYKLLDDVVFSSSQNFRTQLSIIYKVQNGPQVYILMNEKLIYLFLLGATKLLSARRLKLVQKENSLLEREKMPGEQKMR